MYHPSPHYRGQKILVNIERSFKVDDVFIFSDTKVENLYERRPNRTHYLSHGYLVTRTSKKTVRRINLTCHMQALSQGTHRWTDCVKMEWNYVTNLIRSGQKKSRKIALLDFEILGPYFWLIHRSQSCGFC